MLRPLLLIILIMPILAFAQPVTPQLTEQSHVSLITCGPGEELYEAFGHTAILVYDPELQIDYVYNYGTFDFGQPNFYLNFTRGNLLYQLSVSRFGRFINSYKHQNRGVREQMLNLSLEQRQAVFEKLEWNALDENKRYYYDYFFDNCSTRPRDVIEQALEGIITYDSAHVEMPRKTIRELVDRCIIKKLPWGDLGIDICLGQPIDKVATAREYMYLPDELEKAFDHASISSPAGAIPLVKEKFIHFEAVPIPLEKSWFAPQPLFVGILLFFAVILTFMRMWGWNVRWIEGTVFLLFGLLGWSLVLLWFGTNHTAAANNCNLLWAMPLHLFFGVVLYKRSRPVWVSWYALGTIALCLGTLLAWNFLPQLLHYSLKFIVLLQLFVAVGIFRAERISKAKTT